MSAPAPSHHSGLIEANSKMSKKAFPSPPTFKTKLEEREYLKHRLAQAFRIFGHYGYDEGVAGHITVRDPVDPDTFWVNPFGRHFSFIKASDLLHVDHQGNVLPDSGPERLLNTAAFMIHSAIHRARQDVNCAAHSHSIYGRAYSALGKELEMINQDSAAFYKDHCVYHDFRGVVLDEEEGNAITETLGNKKAIFLQNHGILVATPSIEATIHYYIKFEKCAQVQLMVDASGTKPTIIADKEAQQVYNTIGGTWGGYFSGLVYFESLEAREAALPHDHRFAEGIYAKKHHHHHVHAPEEGGFGPSFKGQV